MFTHLENRSSGPCRSFSWAPSTGCVSSFSLRGFGPGGEALAVSHGGAYGTHLLIDNERGLVAAIFTQMPSAQARDFIGEVQQAIEKTF